MMWHHMTGCQADKYAKADSLPLEADKSGVIKETLTQIWYLVFETRVDIKAMFTRDRLRSDPFGIGSTLFTRDRF